MNNTKKTVLGLLVAFLAFGFSAFKAIKKQNVVIYYKTDLNYPAASDPQGYVYFSEDRCEPTGNLCSARWDIGLHPAPTLENTPLPTTGVTFITGSEESGHFE